MQNIFSHILDFSASKGTATVWHKCRLGELTSEFKSGKTIASSEIFETGEYPVYGGNGVRGYADRFSHDGVYAVVGRQGALCGNIRLISGKNYLSEHAIAVQANKDNDTVFLSYLMEYMNLGQFSDQGAQPGLAVNKLVRIKVHAPSKTEQIHIADFLSALGNRINRSIAILSTVEVMKRSLLQQLLI